MVATLRKSGMNFNNILYIYISLIYFNIYLIYILYSIYTIYLLILYLLISFIRHSHQNAISKLIQKLLIKFYIFMLRI